MEERIIKDINNLFTQLFQKMKEEGYEWDAEKKELKKIVQTPVEWHREDEQNLNACLGYIPDEFLRRWLMDAIHTKYDKLAWSEEDERTYKSIIYSFNYNYPLTIRQQEFIKSLKGRITWKPTEPQLVSLTIACDRNDRVGFDLTQLLKELKEL